MPKNPQCLVRDNNEIIISLEVGIKLTKSHFDLCNLSNLVDASTFIRAETLTVYTLPLFNKSVIELKICGK